MDAKTINLIICQKNKKRKIYLNTAKNKLSTVKIKYKHISIMNIDKQFNNIKNITLGLFPEYVYKYNFDNAIKILNNLSQKINLHILKYRSVNNVVLIENIAEICADEILNSDNVNIFNFIRQNFNIDRLFKKELMILPSLIVLMLFKKLLFLYKKLQAFSNEIKIGGTCLKVYSNAVYSNAFYYGLVKYNKNLLKISKNLTVSYRKCVFYFVDELNNIDKKSSVLISYINYLVSRFNI